MFSGFYKILNGEDSIHSFREPAYGYTAGYIAGSNLLAWQLSKRLENVTPFLYEK